MSYWIRGPFNSLSSTIWSSWCHTLEPTTWLPATGITMEVLYLEFLKNSFDKWNLFKFYGKLLARHYSSQLCLQLQEVWLSKALFLYTPFLFSCLLFSWFLFWKERPSHIKYGLFRIKCRWSVLHCYSMPKVRFNSVMDKKWRSFESGVFATRHGLGWNPHPPVAIVEFDQLTLLRDN